MSYKKMGFLLLVSPVLVAMQERKNGGPERVHARKEKKHVHWADGVPAWRIAARESSLRTREPESRDDCATLMFVRECEIQKNVYKCLLCHELFRGANEFVTHVGHHTADEILRLVLRP